MTKFTKGDWHLRGEDSENYAEIIGDMDTNKTIALFPKKCFVPKEEAEANAKLVLHSKDLLRHLVTAVNYWKVYDPIDFAEDMAMTEAEELIKKLAE